MAGAKIPVIEIEQLWIKKSGRGFYGNNDGVTMSGGTWSGIDVSGTNAMLPAASTNAWIKFTIGGTTTYVPGFSVYW